MAGCWVLIAVGELLLEFMRLVLILSLVKLPLQNYLGGIWRRFLFQLHPVLLT